MKRNKTFYIVFLIVYLLASVFLIADSSVSGASQVNKCEINTYTITIENSSADPITNIIVHNFMPTPGFSYVSGSSSISGPGCSSGDDPSINGNELIWDIDNVCGSGTTLDPGQTLTISFDMETDCDAVSGSNNVHLEYDIGGSPSSDDTSISIEVLPGAIKITKTPSVISASVGDNVTWTIKVENTGIGKVKNVEITDILGSGLALVSTNPSGNVNGQTVTWDSSNISQLAEMDPGDTVEIDFQAQVIACENLENKVDARWGCNSGICFDSSSDGGTATSSVQLIVRSPSLDYTPQDINFDYCNDTTTVSFPITNNGDGIARDIKLCVDFGPLSVINVTAPATYTNGCFEIPDLNAGDSYNLEFTLSYSDWCSRPLPSGTLIWLPDYKDECDNEYYPPVKESSYNAPGSVAELTATKTGPTEIQIGSNVNYHITVDYSGTTSCGSGTTGDVNVTDNVPDGFTVVDAGGGTWTPGSNGTGGTITWSFSPSSNPHFETDITLQAPGLDQCEDFCFTTFNNSVEASVDDCCGCALTASDSQTTAIECEQLVDSNKTVSPSTSQKCEEFSYDNQYDFTGSSVLDNVDLSQLQFDEHADNNQQYVSGSLNVVFDGTDITSCVGITDNTPGGHLSLDFSGCTGYGSVKNKSLTITYNLLVTDQSQPSPPCEGSYTFYSWSTLDLGITGGECIQDSEIHETTEVTVEPPAMSVTISGIPSLVERCGSYDFDLIIDRTSTTGVPSDVIVRLNTDNYYVLSVNGYDGVLPVSGPVDHGTYYEWDYGDNFSSDNQGIIHFTIEKRCEGNSGLTASVYYDDNCHNDSQADRICSSSSTYNPPLMTSGDIIIKKTPEVYYAGTNTAQWKIYVINKGNGTAYNVWIDDILGAGLTYDSATVDDMTGVTINPNQDHDGGSINGVGIVIDSMAPAERREITITANIIDCDNLTNDVTASHGCLGNDCQTPVTDTSIVKIPDPILVATNNIPTPINACSEETATITIRNAGQTTVYNLEITETLPAGLNYVSGTTEWSKNGGAWSSGGDPNPSTSPLKWTKNELSALSDLSPGDTLEIRFHVVSDCDFQGGDVVFQFQYENPCGEVLSLTPSTFHIDLNEPDISITKTRTTPSEGGPIDCGQDITWEIKVTNNSGYTLPVLWVEDVLGGAYTYVSSTGDSTYGPADDGYNSGQNVYWELKDFPSGATATLTLTAQSDSAPCSHDLDNTVTAYWGCGSVDGDSSTNPNSESGACLSNSGITDTNTSTREPDLDMGISVSPTSIDSCSGSSTFTVDISNNGNTTAETVDLVITLPPGMSYQTGSSTINCPGGAVVTTDPVISGNQLIYYDIGDTGNNLCDSIPASSTAQLEFSVSSDCFLTSNMNFTLYYYDCCNDTQYQKSTTQQITSDSPQITISKEPSTVNLDCSDPTDTVTWTITVTNNGTGDADWVRIEDTLGDSLVHDSGGTQLGGDPQRWGWEFGPLNSGDSQSFQITAHASQPSDCALSHTTNTVEATWGCGSFDGDPNTTGEYSCQSGITSSDTAEVHLPDISVDSTSTGDFTCSSDGNNTARIMVRVRNDGEAPVNDDFKISVSDDHGWSTTGYYSADFGGTLPIAAHSESTVYINWPLNCMSCDSSITIQLDTDSELCECNENNNTYSFIYHTPSSNLKVNSITPTCSSDGNTLVQVEIENDGCNDASNFVIHLEDNLGHSRDITVASLAAGETSTVNFTNWATNCSPASVTFTATVDYNDNICECNGSDNTMDYNYTNTSPDLTINSVSSSTTCNSDGDINGEIQVSVSNQGNEAVTNDFRIYVNDGQGWSSELWYNADLGGTLPLQSGASETVSFNWTRNFTTSPHICDFNITATVDSQQDVCECTDGNNTATTSYHLPYPDLSITDIDVNCSGDGTYTVNVVVNNEGCEDASNVEILIQDNDGHSQSQTIASLAAGGSTTVSISNWPVDGTPSTLTFTATVDPNNVICELNGTNNTYSEDYTSPNLHLISITPTCTGDNTYRINIDIENNGSSDITNDFMVRLYDNDGHSVESSFTSLGGTLPLVVGSQQTISFNNWVVDCDPTTLTFNGEVDSTGLVCESNDSDNTGNATLEINDLEATSVSANTVCSSDGNITGTIGVMITNRGGTPITNDFRIYVNDGQGWSSELWYNADLGGTLPLGAGASETVSFNWTRNFTTSPHICDFNITATVDSQQDVCECTDGNNTVSTSYHLPYPDLNIQSMNTSCASDGNLQLQLTVSNSGCENLTNDFNIEISDNKGHTNTYTFTSIGGVLPFNAGTQQTLTVTQWQYDCSSQNIDFTVNLDSNSQICELSSTNNTLNITYTLNEPDIQIGDISYDCNPLGALDFTVSILNTGYEDATGVVLNVYDENNALIHTQTLNISQGATENITFTSPHYSECASHNFKFVVDEGENICECNGDNNEKEITTVCGGGLITRKTVSNDKLNACEETEFTLTVENVGYLNAYNIKIIDELPPGFTYVAGSTVATLPGGTFTGDPVISGQTLLWDTGAQLNGGVPEGEKLELRYRAKAGSCLSGQKVYTNSFKVEAEDGSGTIINTQGCDPDDNDPDDSSSVNINMICPVLSVERVCPENKTITMKDNVEYILNITNTGDNNSELNEIEITEELPVGWSFVNYTSTGGSPTQSPSPGDTGIIVWKFGNYKLKQGETVQLKVTLKPSAEACGIQFKDSLKVSAQDNCGNAIYSADANQCNFKLICGAPAIELKKKCPRAQIPGGIYNFELEIKNTGDGKAENILIEDILPDSFQYVKASSLLDNTKIPDPEITGQKLVWRLSELDKGESHTLSYSAIAPSDTDPGRYCNKAKVKGIAPDGTEVSSNTASCCTILRKEVAGCCLYIEEKPFGITHLPQGYFSVVDPYFHTEDSLFISYASLKLWHSGKYQDRRMAERLKNYALFNIEELFFKSDFGLTLPDNTLWMPYAGAYISKSDKGWKFDRLDNKITPSQIAFQLLSLNESLAEIKDEGEKEKIKEIIKKQLYWIKEIKEFLPSFWKFKDGKLLSSGEKASRTQKAIFYYALIMMSKAGYKEVDPIIPKILKNFKIEKFKEKEIKGELFLTLSLIESGNLKLAGKKSERIIQKVKQGKLKLKTIEELALAYLTAAKTKEPYAKEFYNKIIKHYLNNIGIISPQTSDFNYKINLRDTAALIMATETENQSTLFKSVYKSIDEAGLFFRKRLSWRLEYPAVTVFNYLKFPKQSPIFAIMGSPEDVPNVFFKDSVISLPENIKSLKMTLPSEILDVVSDSYENNISRISLDSIALAYLGKKFIKRKDVYSETGREFIYLAKNYIKSLKSVAPGFVEKGELLVPKNEIAIKGKIDGFYKLEPLKEEYSYTTESLANYLLAKNILGEKTSDKFYSLMLARFKEIGYIPKRMDILVNKNGEYEIFASKERAKKITVAKLYKVFGDEMLLSLLSTEKGRLTPEDLIIMVYNPDIVTYFKKELEEIIASNKKTLKWVSSKILAAELLGRDYTNYLNNLKDFYKEELGIPVGGYERVAGGVIYRTDLKEIALYLLAQKNKKYYERTVDFVDHLLQSGWELNYTNDKLSGILSLPPKKIMVIKGMKREVVEPGDLLTFRVTTRNICPVGYNRAKDLPQLLIEAKFNPELIYFGSENKEQLSVIKDFLWKYQYFNEGEILDYSYQALIPGNFKGRKINGELRATGYTGYTPFFPENSLGERCDAYWQVKGIKFKPYGEIKVRVFLDKNANGEFDIGETGIMGIILRDSEGKVYSTDSEGVVTVYTGLKPKTLQLSILDMKSDLYPTTKISRIITGENREVLFGLTQRTRVKGIVYVDSNGNGKYDKGENRVSNVLIKAEYKRKLSGKDGVFEFKLIPVAWIDKIGFDKKQPFYKGTVKNLKIKIWREN